jgi:imidazole glycerol-phosphate synthase subunit HisH
MITIVDYGMGNLGSIENMLNRIKVESIISNETEVIDRAEKLILPGVGAFDHAMSRIGDLGIQEVLDRKVLEEKVPVLGICLGMQLLVERSEEGEMPGLGWIKGEARRFPADPSLKVPHMGWNLAESSFLSPLAEGFPNETRFYFVHSYYVKVTDPKHSMFKTTYGLQFDSGIRKENIFGAQFHPEKSHRFGISLFKKFAAL